MDNFVEAKVKPDGFKKMSLRKFIQVSKLFQGGILSALSSTTIVALTVGYFYAFSNLSSRVDRLDMSIKGTGEKLQELYENSKDINLQINSAEKRKKIIPPFLQEMPLSTEDKQDTGLSFQDSIKYLYSRPDSVHYEADGREIKNRPNIKIGKKYE